MNYFEQLLSFGSLAWVEQNTLRSDFNEPFGNSLYNIINFAGDG